MSERIGIDLGTTNSALARDGVVQAVAEDGRRTLPSVVAFLPNRHAQVGELARRRRAIDSENTIFSSKRIIGRRFDAQETQNFRGRYPFNVVDVAGLPAFQTRAGAVTPEQVATVMLGALVKRTGAMPSGARVTVTVPAAFTQPQRHATTRAAEQAGLGAVELLAEPEATAYAYRAAGARFEHAVVYDLGGGTFDCAVVSCKESEPRLLSHASDLMLGGDDIDHLLADWVARYVVEKHNWDLTNYAEIQDRLLARCEEAKIELSIGEEAEVALAQVDPECPAVAEGVVLTRGQLAKLCSDLVRRTFVVCDGVLRDAKLQPRDVDAVILAGGATLMPMVREGIEAYFGQAGLCDHDPTEVVALGASQR